MANCTNRIRSEMRKLNGARKKNGDDDNEDKKKTIFNEFNVVHVPYKSGVMSPLFVYNSCKNALIHCYAYSWQVNERAQNAIVMKTTIVAFATKVFLFASIETVSEGESECMSKEKHSFQYRTI